ncbi:hypothetical protein SAMN05421679_10239 [Epilithonimonas pallida]|uniref:Uncharacterized protein n=1 Tax=Epilithonimonas pallida TaxID=373671 RepID=A0ABY1QYL6_9FLAO|nr:hypothetical protein SAMN05421679_10239 [Epilithonimonas pallida]
MIIDFLSDIYLGAFIRPPFPLFCAEAFLARTKRAPLRPGRRLVFQSNFNIHSAKIKPIEKIENPQSFS